MTSRPPCQPADRSSAVFSSDDAAQDIAARFQSYAARILTEIKNLIAHTADDRAVSTLIQVVVPHRDEAWLLTGLAGLLQTADWSTPHWWASSSPWIQRRMPTALAEILERECRAPSERRVRYDDGRRRVAGWREMATSLDTRASTPPWRQGATYLITGGMGGLGRLIARDIVARAAAVNLILVGRSARGEDVSLRPLE